MPRPRSRSTQGLPPRVYCGKGRYFIRHEDGHETRLAPASATTAEVWAAYNALPKAEPAPPPEITLRALLDEFEASKQFLKLARSTQADATKAYRMACGMKTKAGGEFGQVNPIAITTQAMRLYMDKRGEKSETRADRELAYLSIAFGWAFERGRMPINPCLGVRRFNPKHRERYVTDEEYAQRLAICVEHKRPDLVVMMELAYLCRLREAEILRMRDTPEFIRPDGVLAKRTKGSKTQVINWSPRLEAAIAAARALPRRMPTPQLLRSAKSGLPWRQRAMQDAWNQMRKIAEKREQAIDWTFHDLKAKGVSDFEGDQHLASGHKTLAMTNVYTRVTGKVDSTR